MYVLVRSNMANGKAKRNLAYAAPSLPRTSLRACCLAVRKICATDATSVIGIQSRLILVVASFIETLLKAVHTVKPPVRVRSFLSHPFVGYLISQY